MDKADMTFDDIPNAKDVIKRAIKILSSGDAKQRQNVLNMFSDITVAEFTGNRTMALVLQ